MKKLIVLGAALVLAVAARAEEVKFKLDGVACPGCAASISKALGSVPKASVTKAPSVADPTAIVNLTLEKGDVGQLAKKVSSAKTPFMKTKPPGATLVLDMPGLTEENAGKLPGALSGVAGVEAEGSRADVASKTVEVKLSKKGGAKLADIRKALEAMTASAE